jgi:hypothetical protein
MSEVAAAEPWCSSVVLGKVGTQSGGKNAVEYPVGQDARQNALHAAGGRYLPPLKAIKRSRLRSGRHRQR